MPGKVERELAEGLAFVAGGWQEEAAVCVEQDAVEIGQGEGVTVRLAMREGVDEGAQECVEEVMATLTRADLGDREMSGEVMEGILRLHGAWIEQEITGRWKKELRPALEEVMGKLDEAGSVVTESVLSSAATVVEDVSVEELLRGVWEAGMALFAKTEEGMGVEEEVKQLVLACFRARKSKVSG